MKTPLRPLIYLLSGALLLGVYADGAHAAPVVGSFDQSISVDEPIFLDVATGSGAIEIRAGSSTQIAVIGRIAVRGGGFLGIGRRSKGEMQEMVDRFESEPPVNLANGRLLVGHIEDRAYQRNVSISYEIVVPAETRVKSHTGSGSQTISGVSGSVEAGTGSGKLILTDVAGEVAVRTGSGAIHADRMAGSFEAHTGSGDVRLTQKAPGDVVVTTGSGMSELRGVVGALNVRAGSGRIVVEGRQEGAWKLDTGSGSVRISLPDDAAFELDAESGSGGITVDHPLVVQGRIAKRHLRGQVRGGGDLLKIDTGSGSIRVE